MKKEKKKRVSLKDKLILSMQSKIQDKVDLYTDNLILKICDYIEYLACDINNNYDLEQILEKVKNKEFLSYDKEKHIENN